MRRAADVHKKIAPADTEKCPQKSAGFDKGMDICGFVADICGHTLTSAMIYANVRGSPHMSAAYARPVADIDGTGRVHLLKYLKVSSAVVVISTLMVSCGSLQLGSNLLVNK